MKLSRRTLLRGIGLGGSAVRVGLPPLAAMFNGSGTAYAADRAPAAVESRFVLWFNGNGIPERYWIPAETGEGFEMTPCLAPLEPFRDDIHVLTGLDNPAARNPGPGNDHHRSMSALVSGTSFTGRGAGGPSIDQILAAKLGSETRFRSLQIGVCQESHGESIHNNLSWAGYDRSLPPEVIPHNLFSRLFGAREMSWIDRKRSVLDAVRDSARQLRGDLGVEDRRRLDEHLTSIRELERSIASLPPEYSRAQEPAEGGDMKDYPRIAKLQSDLLVHAFASGQTRVASYMLTKCQSLARFPWLGYTNRRHHDYTHQRADSPEGQRILRDICRWHVEEFAYFLAKLKSIPEGEATLLDRCCILYVHEHAEANDHKNNGLSAILAGHAGGLKTGLHTEVTGTIGDVYLTLADEVLRQPLGAFPTGDKKLPSIV
ncbi:MAG: DUF1552 domain-containing protein [Bryobacteraceae bacterium]